LSFAEAKAMLTAYDALCPAASAWPPSPS